MIEKLKSWAPNIAAVLALGTFLSILAPYETAGLGLPWIWFYWTGLMALGWICGSISTWAFGFLAPDWPRLAVAAATTVLVSIPVATVVALLQLAFNGPYPLYVLPMIFFFVWVISAGVTTVSVLVESRRAPAAEPAPSTLGPALLDKIPPRLRQAELLALQAEDHYLRVHTSAGDALVLMRLGDAIAAVETLDGAQTHRSWWVARPAVASVSRGDGRAALTLSNGVEAPVSRTYAPKLREAGWY